jgi:hypothetical protein
MGFFSRGLRHPALQWTRLRALSSAPKSSICAKANSTLACTTKRPHFLLATTPARPATYGSLTLTLEA